MRFVPVVILLTVLFFVGCSEKNLNAPVSAPVKAVVEEAEAGAIESGQSLELPTLGLRTTLGSSLKVEVKQDLKGDGHSVVGSGFQVDIGYAPRARSFAANKTELQSAEYELIAEEVLEDGYVLKGVSRDGDFTFYWMDCARTLDSRTFVSTVGSDQEEHLAIGEQLCKGLSRQELASDWFPPSVEIGEGQDLGDVFRVSRTAQPSASIFWIRRWENNDGEILGRITPTPLSANEVTYKNYASFLPGPVAARSIPLEGDASIVMQLTGRSRNPCDEVHVEMSGAGAVKELYLTGTHSLRPRKVTKFKPGKSEQARVKALVGPVNYASTKANGFNGLEGYRADLDGDGSIETILEATGHINEEDESFSFSILLIHSKGNVAWTGYMKEPPDGGEVNKDSDDARNMSMWGIADLDGSGTMELIAMHDESWYHYHHLRTYEWMGQSLVPFTDFGWPERDCYPSHRWNKSQME